METRPYCYILKITLLLFLVTGHYRVSAQQETSQWFLHNGNLIKFNGNTPTATAIYPNYLTPVGTTSLCDAQGNLLFVTDGRTVMNKIPREMPQTFFTTLSSASETIIATKFPGSSTKYYLFYVDNAGYNASANLRYSVVDMTLDGGLGDVTDINTLVAPGVSAGFTVIQQPGTDNYWLVTNEYRTTNFKTYLVTASGISTSPVTSVAGTNPITSEYNFSEMRASHDGKVLAGFCYTTYNYQFTTVASFAEVFNFDGTTGVLTNKVRTVRDGWAYAPRGNVEFSPDDRLLYCLTRYVVPGLQPCGFGHSKLTQYNLCYTDSVEFTNNSMLLSFNSSICLLNTWGRMQLGPDKKIYMPYTGSSGLTRVESPNLLGTSSHTQFDYLPLPAPGGTTTPSFYQHYLAKAVRNNIVYTGSCFPAPTAFSITNDTITTIGWDFGDPASGGNNTSPLKTPAHTFSAPGIYTVTARLYDVNNRLMETVAVPVEIKDPQQRVLYEYPKDTSFCSGITLRLKVKAINGIFLWSRRDGYSGQTYRMGYAADSIDISSGGTYFVEMRQNDCQGCTKVDSIHVTVKPVPDIYLGNDRKLCSGDSLQLYIYDQGAAYQWSTGATTPSITVKQGGTYWVKAEFNNNGCPRQDTIQITSVPNVQFSFGNDTTLCNSNQLVLKPGIAGAYYQWQNGSTASNFIVQQPGTYWAKVTDANSCIKADTIVVAYANAQSLSLGSDTALCNGDNLTLTAAIPNAQYVWSTGAISNTISVNTTGSYWVSADNGICVVKDTIAVAFNPKPVFSFGKDSVLCDGQLMVLKPGIAQATYHWQDNTTNNQLIASQPGAYWAKVTLQGCVVADTIVVSYQSQPTLQLGNDTTICEDQSLTINALQATIATYRWQDGFTGANRTLRQPGNYWLEATGNNGCIKRDSIQLKTTALPGFTLGNDTTLCNGQTLSLAVTIPGAATYLWSNNSTQNILMASQPGNYWLQVKQYGCSKTDTIAIAYKPAPVVNLGTDTVLCPGATLLLNAAYAGATYTWQDQSTRPGFLVTQSGQYTVTALLNGCAAKDAITVTYRAKPVITAQYDSLLCPGQVLVLTPQAGNAALLWSDGSTTPQYTVKTPGLYAVTATNVCGSAYRSFTIVQAWCKLAMPNAFTPNKDNRNDLFKVGSPGFIKTFYMAVYNRWGQRIYETRNPYAGWDGTVNGIEQPTGTYIWTITLTDKEGVQAAEKGQVVLIR